LNALKGVETDNVVGNEQERGTIKGFGNGDAHKNLKKQSKTKSIQR